MSDQSARARALEEAIAQFRRMAEKCIPGGEGKQAFNYCADKLEVFCAAAPSVAPPPVPCPWTKAEIEQTVTEFLSPQGANASDITKMLRYLAASQPEPPSEEP